MIADVAPVLPVPHFYFPSAFFVANYLTAECRFVNMEPVVSYGDPYSMVTNPETQIAHIALGDYGPLGVKQTTDEFLNKRK